MTTTAEIIRDITHQLGTVSISDHEDELEGYLSVETETRTVIIEPGYAHGWYYRCYDRSLPHNDRLIINEYTVDPSTVTQMATEFLA